MANPLANIVQAIAGLLRPGSVKKPDPRAPIPSAPKLMEPAVPDYGLPAAPQAKPIGIGGDDPELTRLYGQRDEAMGVLKRPMPKMQEAKPNTLESLLSVVLAGANPYAAGKTLEVPGQLAQQRADAANKPVMQQFALDRETAEKEVDSTGKLIDVHLDRDSVAAKVAEMGRIANAKLVAKRESEAIKNDQVMVKTLANLYATGGATVPGIAAIYVQRGYEHDEATAIAEQVVKQLDPVNGDPSLKMKMQMASQVTKQMQADTQQRKGYRDALMDENATDRQRLGAMMALAEIGDPMFAGMSYADMVAASKEDGAKTQKIESDIEIAKKKADQWVKESDARISKIASDVEKDGALIRKWETETSQKGRKLDWQMRTGGRPSGLDNTLLRLRIAKEGLLAEAEEWQNQNSADLFGVEVQGFDKNAASALAKIRREIAGIDAKIRRVRRMGAQEDDPQGFAPVQPSLNGPIGVQRTPQAPRQAPSLPAGIK